MTGTSMGGFVGAFYADGRSTQEIEEILIEAQQGEILRGRPDGPGIFGLAEVESFLRRYFGGKHFSDLKIPFAVTATDLDAGVEVVVADGPVVDGVMATIALPGIFSPRWLHGQRVVDGGIVDPVPIRPLRAFFNGVIVAVVLAAPPEEWSSRQTSDLLDDLPMMRLVGRLRPAQALGIFLRAMEISGRNFTELRLAVDRPDVIIRPDVSHISLLADDADMQGLIQIGWQAAERALPDVEAQFSFARRLLRRVRMILKRMS
jgi:NTE family protein